VISFPLLITIRHVVSFAIRNIAALQKIKFAIAGDTFVSCRRENSNVRHDSFGVDDQNRRKSCNILLEKMDIANDQWVKEKC